MKYQEFKNMSFHSLKIRVCTAGRLGITVRCKGGRALRTVVSSRCTGRARFLSQVLAP